MKDVKLTVALLTYNRCQEGYFGQALNAILEQTYPDFELLVVDNHSTDDTAATVLSCKDPRLHYVRQPPGGNPTCSYNHALWASRGEYVLFTHDDDMMGPTMLQQQMAFLSAHPGLMCLATNVSLMDGAGNMTQPQLYDLTQDTVFEPVEYIHRYFEEKLWLPTPTLMYHRDSYIDVLRECVRKKDPPYAPSGDLWAAFSMNLRGPIGMLAQPLLRYRQHPGQESRRVDQSEPIVDVIRTLLETHGADPRLQPELPAIRAYWARFRAQDALLTSCSSTQRMQSLERIKQQWEKSVGVDHRAVDAFLPVEILFAGLGWSPSLSPQGLDNLMQTSARSGARRGFRAWLQSIHRGTPLFAGTGAPSRVAIFGSVLTAHLIVLHARRAGIDVAFCFDSSPARIGRKVFDVPVVPLADLAQHVSTVDAIILSSEHDQEDALKAVIANSLQRPAPCPVLSWKDLLANTAEP